MKGNSLWSRLKNALGLESTINTEQIKEVIKHVNLIRGGSGTIITNTLGIPFYGPRRPNPPRDIGRYNGRLRSNVRFSGPNTRPINYVDPPPGYAPDDPIIISSDSEDEPPFRRRRNNVHQFSYL